MDEEHYYWQRRPSCCHTWWGYPTGCPLLMVGMEPKREQEQVCWETTECKPMVCSEIERVDFVKVEWATAASDWSCYWYPTGCPPLDYVVEQQAAPWRTSSSHCDSAVLLPTSRGPCLGLPREDFAIDHARGGRRRIARCRQYVCPCGFGCDGGGGDDSCSSSVCCLQPLLRLRLQ